MVKTVEPAYRKPGIAGGQRGFRRKSSQSRKPYWVCQDGRRVGGDPNYDPETAVPVQPNTTPVGIAQRRRWTDATAEEAKNDPNFDPEASLLNFLAKEVEEEAEKRMIKKRRKKKKQGPGETKNNNDDDAKSPPPQSAAARADRTQPTPNVKLDSLSVASTPATSNRRPRGTDKNAGGEDSNASDAAAVAALVAKPVSLSAASTPATSNRRSRGDNKNPSATGNVLDAPAVAASTSPEVNPVSLSTASTPATSNLRSRRINDKAGDATDAVDVASAAASATSSPPLAATGVASPKKVVTESPSARRSRATRSSPLRTPPRNTGNLTATPPPEEVSLLERVDMLSNRNRELQEQLESKTREISTLNNQLTAKKVECDEIVATNQKILVMMKTDHEKTLADQKAELHKQHEKELVGVQERYEAQISELQKELRAYKDTVLQQQRQALAKSTPPPATPYYTPCQDSSELERIRTGGAMRKGAKGMHAKGVEPNEAESREVQRLRQSSAIFYDDEEPVGGGGGRRRASAGSSKQYDDGEREEDALENNIVVEAKEDEDEEFSIEEDRKKHARRGKRQKDPNVRDSLGGSSAHSEDSSGMRRKQQQQQPTQQQQRRLEATESLANPGLSTDVMGSHQQRTATTTATLASSSKAFLKRKAAADTAFSIAMNGRLFQRKRSRSRRRIIIESPVGGGEEDSDWDGDGEI